MRDLSAGSGGPGVVLALVAALLTVALAAAFIAVTVAAFIATGLAVALLLAGAAVMLLRGPLTRARLRAPPGRRDRHPDQPLDVAQERALLVRSQNEIATPSAPARAVRPMRCT